VESSGGPLARARRTRWGLSLYVYAFDQLCEADHVFIFLAAGGRLTGISGIFPP